MSIRNRSTLIVIAYLFTALSWGGSYLGIRYVVAVLPPVFGAMLRVALAGVIISLLTARDVRASLRKPLWVLFTIFTGFFSMGMAWALLFWGEVQVAPALSAILIGATPIFTTLVLPLVDRSRPVTRYQWWGVALGFSGLLLIFAPQLHGESTGTLPGMLAVLGCAISYGIGTTLQQSITKIFSGRVVLAWQAVGALLILIPVSHYTETWPTFHYLTEQHAALFSLLYLSTCSTAIAFVCWFYLIREIGSVRTSTITYCSPLVSVLLDTFWLHLIPAWNVLIGAAIIIASVRLTQRKAIALQIQPMILQQTYPPPLKGGVGGG